MSDRNLRIQMLLQGFDKLSKPLREVSQASSATRKALGETQAKLKQLDAAQKDVGRFRELKSGLKQSDAAMSAAQQRVATLARALASTENPTKKMQSDFAKAKREATGLANAHRTQTEQLQALRGRLDAAGVSTRNLVADERRLREEAERTTGQLRRQQAQLEKQARSKANRDQLSSMSGKAAAAGTGMTATGVAMGAPVMLAVKQAMTLESAMADVRKVVDFPTPKAFAQMSDDILNMSTRIPMAAEGIAQIVAAAGRANIPRQELLRFAEDAAKMGVAFDSTADVAGEMMAKWRTGFSMSQTEVVALADRINALTNAYGGNVGAVSDMVTRIGALGEVNGVSAPQVAAMAQLLSSVGVESEVGATGIKNMMLALTKGEAATKSQSGAFKALGLDAVQLSKDMQRDAGGAILKVMERLQALPEAARPGTLTNLFGSESVAAIAPMLTKLDQLKTNFRMIGDNSQYAGSMNQEYLSAISKTEGATGLATNALSALNIKMGQTLLPTVVAVSDKVRVAANALRGWAVQHPLLAKGIMMFAAVGAILLVLLGGLALGFAALTAAAGMFGIALGPLLLIATAIAAVATAAYLIYDNWGAVSAWFAGLWEGMSGSIGRAIIFMEAVLTNFSPMGILYAGFAALLNWLGISIPAQLSSIGTNIVQGLWKGIADKKDWLIAKLKWFATLIPEPIRRALGINSPSRLFHQYGDFMMQGLEGGIVGGQDGPIKRIGGIAADITRALAVGAATPAIAAAPLSDSASRGAIAAAAPMGPISITIQQLPGQDSADLARLVRQEIETIRRQERAAQRSSFSDEPDYGGFA